MQELWSNPHMKTDELRRKLSFRSWHRGTREMDLLMGNFADYILPDLDETGLDAYARLLEENDPDLYDYYCDRKEVETFDKGVSRDILRAFKEYKVSSHTRSRTGL